ncbi:MAG: hypothetical protein WD555_05375 [Fulvivirga sp.]
MNLTITASALITPQAVHLNEQPLMHNDQGLPFDQYARSLYKRLELTYPKFFKMDELCQLAFLSAELLTQHLDDWNGDEVAIVIGNKHASIASDQKHHKTIADKADYFPGPAVFVYTLPNIMLGEICIRQKITGENSCFIMDQLDAEFLYPYVHHLFKTEDYRYCITGFVDYTDESYLAQLFLIEPGEKGNGPLAFNEYFNKIRPL